LTNPSGNKDDLSSLCRFRDPVGLKLSYGLTFDAQFWFQKPGVSHGQAAVPPESMQAEVVKSLENQKFIAKLMALLNVGSEVH